MNSCNCVESNNLALNFSVETKSSIAGCFPFGHLFITIHHENIFPPYRLKTISGPTFLPEIMGIPHRKTFKLNFPGNF